MKLLSLLGAAALLAVSLSAARADQLADVKARGKLICGTLGTAEPFSFQHPQTREIVGYDVDICRKVADQILPVTDTEAMETARALAKQEGIFCGISCGGTFAAALKVAKDAPKGSVILAMLPDTGERYLSTALFADIPEGSDPEPA